MLNWNASPKDQSACHLRHRTPREAANALMPKMYRCKCQWYFAKGAVARMLPAPNASLCLTRFSAARKCAQCDKFQHVTRHRTWTPTRLLEEPKSSRRRGRKCSAEYPEPVKKSLQMSRGCVVEGRRQHDMFAQMPLREYRVLVGRVCKGD